VLLTVLGATSPGAEPSGTPVTSRAAAVALARAFTGLSEEISTAAAQRVVTDDATPVFDVKDRSVWEVVFESVRISVPGREGEWQDNPNIDALTLWIDAQTGGLVKAFTPEPAEGGLSLKVGEFERGALEGMGFLLKECSAPPASGLMSALAFVEAIMPGHVPEAKQVVAYHVLLTNRFDIEREWVDRPVWLIYLAGVSVLPPSGGPPGAPPVRPAPEMLVVLDATTGKMHRIAADREGP
jgi:hypothetical protein